MALLCEAERIMRDVLIFRAQAILGDQGRDIFVRELVDLLTKVSPEDPQNELSRCLHAYRILSALHWADIRFVSKSSAERLNRKAKRVLRGAGPVAAPLVATGHLPEEPPPEWPLDWQGWQWPYWHPYPSLGACTKTYSDLAQGWDYPAAYGYPYGWGFPFDQGFTPVALGGSMSQTLPVPLAPPPTACQPRSGPDLPSARLLLGTAPSVLSARAVPRHGETKRVGS